MSFSPYLFCRMWDMSLYYTNLERKLPIDKPTLWQRDRAPNWLILLQIKKATLDLQLKEWFSLGGPHSTMDSILALHPVAPGLILNVPKNFSLREFFSWCCWDLLTALHCLVSRQCGSLIVDQTYLGLLDITTDLKRLKTVTTLL